MKKLLLVLLFGSTISFGQIKIEPLTTGIPARVATELTVRVLPFETTATTCALYWVVKDDEGASLAEGNIQLTEVEFAFWGQNNSYIENLVLARLNLRRKCD